MTPAAPASAEPMKNVNDDHPVDVDAHHRRRLEVERGRAHRPPDLGPRDEQREPGHEDDARHDHEELHVLDVERTDRDTREQ